MRSMVKKMQVRCSDRNCERKLCIHYEAHDVKLTCCRDSLCQSCVEYYQEDFITEEEMHI